MPIVALAVLLMLVIVGPPLMMRNQLQAERGRLPIEGAMLSAFFYGGMVAVATVSLILASLFSALSPPPPNTPPDASSTE